MTSADVTYRVRPALAADLWAVVSVLGENRPTAPAEPTEPPDAISQRQQATWDRMMNTPDLMVYLAETEDAAVGTATAMVMPHVTYDCRPTTFIEAMVVKYAHRRQGVARMLLHHVLADARAASCRKVQLLSHKRHADDGAHQLYRSVGFEPEAEGFRLYLDS